MTLIAAGLSHQTAPVEDRERFAIGGDELPDAMRHFHKMFGHSAILSTCNRTEIYVNPHNNEVEPADLIAELAEFKGLRTEGRLPGHYALRGRDVPKHLFRVAAGVDSMILGESQVLGQVRTALSAAHEAHSLDAALSRLLHDALHTGRRARHETNIGRYAVSVSSAAVTLARDHVADFETCRALVVGAGEAGKLAARALRDQGVRDITVTSRTRERAEDLATYLNGTVVSFDQLSEAIAAADLVISSSSAPGYLITPDVLSKCRNGAHAPLTVMDVAVPRDVDPAIRDLPNVNLLDIDDLQAMSEVNLRRREEAAAQVFRIVNDAVDSYEEWLEARRAVPSIKAIVRRADEIRCAELERTLSDLDLSPANSEKLDRMTAAIVKKLLHEPIDYLRSAEDREESSATVRRIFGVEDA
ncbi:MAG TPA: glutamyl-tRNA reductase [Dehalococcoidia bacterium]|nr:glutamyl-tRNA reductase [Dehalococcoidia bacterium]